jgi:hypothetical protein
MLAYVCIIRRDFYNGLLRLPPPKCSQFLVWMRTISEEHLRLPQRVHSLQRQLYTDKRSGLHIPHIINKPSASLSFLSLSASDRARKTHVRWYSPSHGRGESFPQRAHPVRLDRLSHTVREPVVRPVRGGL